MPTESLSLESRLRESSSADGSSRTVGSSPAEHFLSRSDIERLQFRKLRALLKAILPPNPFYSRKLANVHSELAFTNLADYARVIPFTTKHELVEDRLAHPPYGTDLTFPLSAYTRCHQTSGSTTVPIRWLDTQESWGHLVENWVQILAAAGIRREDRFFFAFSFGPFLGFWSALEAVQRLGCFSFPGGAMNSLARLQAILENEITVVCCTPTYAQSLGETARDKKVDLSRSRVRLFIVAGGSGRQHFGDPRADRIALAWRDGVRSSRHD